MIITALLILLVAPPAPAPVHHGSNVELCSGFGGSASFAKGSDRLQAEPQATFRADPKDPFWEYGWVTLHGTGDKAGSAAGNAELALRRAEAVRQHLIAAGIAPDRVRVDQGRRYPLTGTVIVREHSPYAIAVAQPMFVHC